MVVAANIIGIGSLRPDRRPVGHREHVLAVAGLAVFGHAEKNVGDGIADFSRSLPLD